MSFRPEQDSFTVLRSGDTCICPNQPGSLVDPARRNSGRCYTLQATPN
ncbi:hypothetical protein [Terriglobus sp.]